MRFVDQRGMGAAGSVDPRPGGLPAAGVERDRDDLESLGVELLAQLAPAGQIRAAAAPRGPGDHQRLAAAQRAQREPASVAVGEDDVWQLGAGERVSTRLRAERPEAMALVVDERHAEPPRQLAAIE